MKAVGVGENIAENLFGQKGRASRQD
jgi:hypothetical protein